MKWISPKLRNSVSVSSVPTVYTKVFQPISGYRILKETNKHVKAAPEDLLYPGELLLCAPSKMRRQRMFVDELGDDDRYDRSHRHQRRLSEDAHH